MLTTLLIVPSEEERTQLYFFPDGCNVVTSQVGLDLAI